MVRLLIFLIVFICSTLPHHVIANIDCQNQAYIPQIECEALVAIYNSTNGSGWYSNSGWLTDSDPRSWYGVETYGSDKIFGLSLAGNNLTGSLPPEIGNFAILGDISFESNQLTGSLPAEIGNLANLSGLNLSSNQLSGSIPTEIGNLSKLRFLYLDSNQLSGLIPAEIGSLSSLETLVLGSNQLSGSIPAEIGNLSTLTSMDLSLNQLSGSIPSEIGNLSSLISLDLNSNQLSGPVPVEVGNLSSLIRLHLRLNNLTGPVPLAVAQLGAGIDTTRCSFAPYDQFGENALCLPNVAEYHLNGSDPYCGLLLSNDCITPGDVDGNGVMDLSDTIVELRLMAGLSTDYIYLLSDTDGDAKIGLNDAIYTIRRNAGLITEYDNQTMQGVWLIREELSEDYFGYFIADGAGDLTGHSNFNPLADPGDYQVLSDGSFSVTFSHAYETIILTGNFASAYSGDLNGDYEGLIIEKVLDLSAGAGTWSGTFVDLAVPTDTEAITFTVNEQGTITSFNGLAGTGNGNGGLYMKNNRAVGFIHQTGMANPWDQIKPMGLVSGDTFSGEYELNNGAGNDGTFSLMRTVP